MVSDALRRYMIAADGAGELVGDDVRVGTAEHAVCGDEVEVSLRLDGARIAELRWRASGCPACVAVASVASSALRDCPADDVGDALHRRIAELGGLAAHERHAERLFLRALELALQG